MLQQSRPEDLNTYAWGSCHNKTLHLAYFLGHTQASQQLIQQGALDTVANDLGFQPKDVISQQTKKDNSKKPSGKQQRPKYSSPDRFQQLRALAESPAKQQQEDANNNNNSKNAPDDVRPQGQRHHQDFALLAKRSPVKNNPLLKKFEQQQQSSSSANRLAVPSGKAASLLSPDSAGGDPEIRRNSKVINSLKNKSYVSTSVFRQAEPAVSTSRAPSPSRGASPTPSRSTSPLPSRSASPLPPVTVTPAQDTSSKIPENDMTKQPIQTADSEKGGSENLSAQKKEQPVIVCQEEQTPEEKDKKRSVDKDDDKGQDVDKEDQTSKGRDQDKEEQGLKREQGPDMDKEAVADDKDDVDKEQDDDKDDDEEDEEDVTKARDIEKEKQRLSRRFVSADAEEARRWSGSQRSHWSVGVNSWGNVLNRGSVASKKENRKSLHSDSDGEQWFDSYEDWTEGADGRLSLKAKPRNSRDGIPPVPNLPTTTTTNTTARQSMLSRQVLPDAPSPVVQLSQVDSHEKETEENNTCGEEEGPEEMIHYKPDTRFSARFDDDEDSVIDSLIHDNSLRQSRSVDAKQAEGNKSGDETSVESRAPSASFSPPQRGSAGAESMDTWPSPEVKKQTLSEQHDEKDAVPAEPSQILMKPDEKFGSVSVTTSQYISHRLRPESNNLQEQALATFDNEAYRDFLEYRPSSVKLQLPLADVSPSRPLSSATAMMSNPAHGKLYVRVNSAEDLLLPLPKITTYVRCVVSDGQYEYMSKYEVLSQRVSFAYECIIDTHPDMIVTVALHVRPDVHVRPKTGISRWFTSIRKQRETLPGYVHPEDGAIGQSRFALQHMMEACYQKTYKANFDCFNSWYARSARERQRQQQFGGDDDVLKVVGNLNVEMLYLPVSDPSLVSCPSPCFINIDALKRKYGAVSRFLGAYENAI